MAEPVEIKQVRAEHPDWQPGQICHCYDDEDGTGHKIQDGRHGTLINVAIVGNTADGAKGSSFQAGKRLIRAVSPDYCTDNIKGGYNSSEALIGDITDYVEKTKGRKNRGCRGGGVRQKAVGC
jgi:hypothetical protein